MVNTRTRQKLHKANTPCVIQLTLIGFHLFGHLHLICVLLTSESVDSKILEMCLAKALFLLNPGRGFGASSRAAEGSAAVS